MKILRVFLLLIPSLVIWLLVSQYFFCPQLSFSKPGSFSGNNFYNPYARIDSGQWIKCNFHAHTNAWGGVTNGKGNAADIWRVYDSLGYDVHCVSEYHKINDDHSDQQNYIPIYEHGYNLKKVHQLIAGSAEVQWLDYVFPQTISNKQWMLNKLSEKEGNVVILAHPSLRKGYSIDDMKSISGYHCMEVLNPVATSFAHWDAALSSGKHIFIVGNDDIHNVHRGKRLGRFCTWLNVSSVNQENVLNALKSGNGYAMKIGEIPNEEPEDRFRRLKYELPSLKNFLLSNDTIKCLLSSSAKEIIFSGENGRTLAVINNTDNASYKIDANDSYVRITAIFGDGTTIYLNPVSRYTNTPLEEQTGFIINTGKTNLFFILGVMILSGWVILCIRLLFARYFRGRRLKNKLSPLAPQPYPAALENI